MPKHDFDRVLTDIKTLDGRTFFCSATADQDYAQLFNHHRDAILFALKFTKKMMAISQTTDKAREDAYTFIERDNDAPHLTVFEAMRDQAIKEIDLA